MKYKIAEIGNFINWCQKLLSYDTLGDTNQLTEVQ